MRAVSGDEIAVMYEANPEEIDFGSSLRKLRVCCECQDLAGRSPQTSLVY